MTDLAFADLKKTAIIFGLEDILIPGTIEPTLNMEEVHHLLKELSELERKYENDGFHIFLMTGLPSAVAMKKIHEHKLGEYFKAGHVFSVDQDYLMSKEEIDRSLYQKNIEKNPHFKDEYFKQVMIEKIAKDFNIEKEKMILIGNDVWTEGYYTCRFSKIDFAIIKSASASLGEKKEGLIPGVVYIERTWDAIQKILLEPIPPHDCVALEKFVFKIMGEKLTEGTAIGGLAKVANRNQL